MKQKALSKWLKIILIGVGICGLIVYLVIFPGYGQSLVSDYPEFSNRYLPWLIFLWMTGIPCGIVLVLGWRIASNIGKDNSFSNENAKYLKWISWFAAGDGIFFFFGNVVLLFANMSHPGVALFSLLVVFAGIAVTVASSALSHLVQKAAVLQEQSDLTI
ncbi:MAG: DUF2975 domain-containing protein [Parasporobacterium sp.]|nr:DUF2975 domain-containing protein [Parasporobacterium sp.]